jgi:hypothetical protein
MVDLFGFHLQQEHILQQHNFIFYFLCLSDECGCFKEHSEVKKAALDVLYLKERKQHKCEEEKEIAG